MRSLAALALVAGPAAAKAQTAAQLAWLSAGWQVVVSEPGAAEQRMAPAGGQVRQWEFLRVLDAAQQLDFVAAPNRQATTVFRAEAVAPRRMACPS